jgi:lysophospholipase L1-like esterase
MRRLLRLAVVAVSVLTAAAASELALRATGYQYSPLKIGATVQSDSREQHAFHDRDMAYDPDLIWRPVGGPFSPFNPQGFRGIPVDQVKPPGVFRIIALGDSNTFGWAVDAGANWPAQLQRRFARSHPGVEVINAGVWGYASLQGLRRFKEIVAFNPDLVLVSFGGNDAHQVLVPDAEYVRRHDRIERLTRLSRKLRLAQLAVAGWDRLAMATGATGRLVPRVSLEEYVSHLREIVQIARSRGIQVVLLTRPYTGTSTDPALWKTHAPAFNQATRDTGRAENVPVIDVYQLFKDHPAYFDDEAHFGVEGNRVAAELFHAELARMIR